MTDAQERNIAQINLARSRTEIDHENLDDFKAATDPVNALAARSQGFVWRHVSPPEGDLELNNPRHLVNMSVWKTPEDLENFVWNTVHKRVYAKKDKWFEAPPVPDFAMWWVEPGHFPSLAEGLQRLTHLREHGPSEKAFGWESLPNIRLWLTRQCG